MIKAWGALLVVGYRIDKNPLARGREIDQSCYESGDIAIKVRRLSVQTHQCKSSFIYNWDSTNEWRAAVILALRRSAYGIVVFSMLSFCSMAFASDIQKFFTRAAVAVANLKFEQAFDIYSDALELNPNLKERAELLRFRALASDLAGKTDRAEADYTAAVELVGNTDPRAYRNRGEFYFQHQRLELALADFKSGAALYPNDGTFPHGQGLALADQGKFEEAIGRYDEAIKLDPASAEFMLGRAEAYNRSDRPKLALLDYDKAIALGGLVRKDKARLRLGRGHANFKLQDYAAAIEDFNAALELKPSSVLVLKMRGLSFERIGENDRASRDYEAALKLKPADGWLATRVQALQAK